MAFGAHSALCHYSATRTDVRLDDTGLFLTDSGGNYLTGTTDITRTVCLETLPCSRSGITPGAQRPYRCGQRVFSEGTRGFRSIPWPGSICSPGMNFGHGTGRGVGSFVCS